MEKMVPKLAHVDLLIFLMIRLMAAIDAIARRVSHGACLLDFMNRSRYDQRGMPMTHEQERNQQSPQEPEIVTTCNYSRCQDALS